MARRGCRRRPLCADSSAEGQRAEHRSTSIDSIYWQMNLGWAKSLCQSVDLGVMVHCRQHRRLLLDPTASCEIEPPTFLLKIHTSPFPQLCSLRCNGKRRRGGDGRVYTHTERERKSIKYSKIIEMKRMQHKVCFAAILQPSECIKKQLKLTIALGGDELTFSTFKLTFYIIYFFLFFVPVSTVVNETLH